MPHFIKKPVVTEAHQWHRNGDHPLDNVFRPFEWNGRTPKEPREGEIVRYFRHPSIPGEKVCADCGHNMRHHGWIDSVNTLNPTGCTVCPGDWILPEPKNPGKFCPCKPAVFEENYEPAGN